MPNPQRPEHRESMSVTGYTEHSDEHAAKHDARSGMRHLPARNEMKKPGASEDTDQKEKTGARCECSGVEEHRTIGGADGDGAKTSMVPRHVGGNTRLVSVQNQMVAICRTPTAKRPRTTDRCYSRFVDAQKHCPQNEGYRDSCNNHCNRKP